MKQPIDEVDDDLAAEEENKLINEVGSVLCHFSLVDLLHRNTRHGSC